LNAPCHYPDSIGAAAAAACCQDSRSIETKAKAEEEEKKKKKEEEASLYQQTVEPFWDFVHIFFLAIEVTCAEENLIAPVLIASRSTKEREVCLPSHCKNARERTANDEWASEQKRILKRAFHSQDWSKHSAGARKSSKKKKKTRRTRTTTTRRSLNPPPHAEKSPAWKRCSS
jgi:hypothetical protein